MQLNRFIIASRIFNQVPQFPYNTDKDVKFAFILMAAERRQILTGRMVPGFVFISHFNHVPKVHHL